MLQTERRLRANRRHVAEEETSAVWTRVRAHVCTPVDSGADSCVWGKLWRPAGNGLCFIELGEGRARELGGRVRVRDRRRQREEECGRNR